ncbi:MAG: DNA processing protein [Pirellulaceae bacterium]|jgi:DNA processing protein
MNASPATTSDLRKDTILLSMVNGVGPRIYSELIHRFETPTNVLNAKLSDLQSITGIGGKLSHRIALAHQQIDVDKELKICRDNDVEVLFLNDAHYPKTLRDIPDPPVVLFLKGTIEPTDCLAIAIVGSRRASTYGRTQANRLARELCNAGFAVVSGLARGIDSAAHHSAIQQNGRTIAVLGSGVLNIYPPEHNELANDVCQNGCLISESPPLRQPFSGAFPQRNRIITGLSLGVVVVEASARSGALISARHALEQGKEVFAVPGRVDSNESKGCHQLLRDGAKLVESIDDILEELGPLAHATTKENGDVILHPVELQLNEIENNVLMQIDVEPTSIDDICHKSEMPIHQVLATVSVLEMKHLVQRLSGNYVARTRSIVR